MKNSTLWAILGFVTTLAVGLLVFGTVLVVSTGGDDDKTASDQATATTTAPSSAEPVPMSPHEQYMDFASALISGGIEPPLFDTSMDAVENSMKFCRWRPIRIAEYLNMVEGMFGDSTQEEEAIRAFMAVYCLESVAKLDNLPIVKPKRSDFKINVKVRQQECFGSAGCLVTVGVTPQYVGTGVLEGSWDVTYKIHGDEDGPVIDTFTLTGDQVEYNPEANLSTTSSSTKIFAKITSIDEAL